MIIGIYIDKNYLKTVIKQFECLDRSICPSYFGADENRKKVEGALNDERAYSNFIDANPKGFFLFANDCRYDIAIQSENIYASIFIDLIGSTLSLKDVTSILNSTTRVAALKFAFSGSQDEYYYRNRYVRKIGANSIEAWVGRDVRKYIPGVYWLTVLLEEEANSIGLDKLPESHILKLENGYVAIMAYPDFCQWLKYISVVNKIIERTPRIFSLNRIKPQLDNALDYSSLSFLLSQWK